MITHYIPQKKSNSLYHIFYYIIQFIRICLRQILWISGVKDVHTSYSATTVTAVDGVNVTSISTLPFPGTIPLVGATLISLTSFLTANSNSKLSGILQKIGNLYTNNSNFSFSQDDVYHCLCSSYSTNTKVYDTRENLLFAFTVQNWISMYWNLKLFITCMYSDTIKEISNIELVTHIKHTISTCDR